MSSVDSSVVLIPRRLDKLSATSARVAALGYESVPFALLDFEALPCQMPADVQAIVVTSSAALEAMPRSELPVYCVGEQTAREAQEYGFNIQHIGSGNAADLAEWIGLNLPPQHLYHPTAEGSESQWYQGLQTLGFQITPAHVYKKSFATELPTEVVCCLTENKVSFTLVFSAKSAQVLKDLCQKYNLPLSTLGTIVAISNKVAEQFAEQHTIMVAKQPNLQEMLNVLEQTTQ